MLNFMLQSAANKKKSSPLIVLQSTYCKKSFSLQHPGHFKDLKHEEKSSIRSHISGERMEISDQHQELLNTIKLIHNFGLDFGADLPIYGISRKSFRQKLYSSISKNKIILQCLVP